jgi:uncharacterized protein
MKLQADQPNALNTVTAYGDDYIEINQVKHSCAVLVMPQGAVTAWGAERFEDLTSAHFSGLSAMKPELIIFGTGAKQRFAHPKLMADLASARIGVETMSTQAACRTYNILMAEGRQVLLATLIL